RARKNLSPGHHPSGGRVSPLHARQPSRYALAAGSSPEETGTLFPPAPRDQTRSAARRGAPLDGRAGHGRRPRGPRASANRARAPALKQGPARGSISIEPEWKQKRGETAWPRRILGIEEVTALAQAFFVYQSALIWVKLAHFSGRSSNAKMAVTGQTGTHAPQSIHSTGLM